MLYLLPLNNALYYHDFYFYLVAQTDYNPNTHFKYVLLHVVCVQCDYTSKYLTQNNIKIHCKWKTLTWALKEIILFWKDHLETFYFVKT